MFYRDINLDNVRKVEWIKKGKNHYLIMAVFNDGHKERLDECSSSLDLNHLTAPVIPANPGWEEVQYWFDPDCEPSIDAIMKHMQRVPIIGWRMMPHVGPLPITVRGDTEMAGNAYAILQPNGQLHGAVGVGGRWPNIDEWVKETYADWQQWYAEKQLKSA